MMATQNEFKLINSIVDSGNVKKLKKVFTHSLLSCLKEMGEDYQEDRDQDFDFKFAEKF